MGALPDARREKARLLYLQSHKKMKLADIGTKLGVPVSTIKSWKSRDKWDAPKQKKPVGAQLGSQNAKGHAPSSPPRNKNALSTGRCEAIYFTDLTDEEKELISSAPLSPKGWLQREAMIYTVREKRILDRIRVLQTEEKSRMVVTRLTVTKYTPKKGVEKGAEDEEDSIPSRGLQGTTTTAESENINLPLAALEDALTKVQAGLRSTLIAIHRIEMDEKAMEMVENKDKERKDVEDLSPLALLLNGEIQQEEADGKVIVLDDRPEGDS